VVSSIGLVPITPPNAAAVEVPASAEPAPTAPALPSVPTADRPPSPQASSDDGGATPRTAAKIVDGAVAARLDRNPSAPLIVEVIAADGDAAGTLRRLGEEPIGALGDIGLVELTPTRLRELAATGSLSQIRLPADFRRASFGLPRPQRGTPSDAMLPWTWEGEGLDGSGVAIGIIDIFDPAVLATQIASTDLPPIPTANRRCFSKGLICPFGLPGYTHGNSVADIVADGAPGATLYLAEVDTITDYIAAIDWFASNGVRIINHSAGGPFDGPGDGTGAAAMVIDYAVNKGMTWFNSAATPGPTPAYTTFAGGYWRGTWADPDNDRWLNFKGTDESLTAYCGALFGLRWSDWGALRTDYDLYISDYRASTRSNGSKVLASAWNQAAGAAPLEGNDLRWLCNTNSAYGPVYDINKDGFVSLWVARSNRSSASPTGDVLEIMVNGGWLEHSSVSGSAALPFADSRNGGMATVGALGWSEEVAPYSGRGPTNDGRTKPDFVALGCLRTSIDGPIDPGCQTYGFSGTSAAAPMLAGMAAIGLDVFGFPRPADVISWLRARVPSNIDSSVKNNTVGWGWPRWSEEVPKFKRGGAYLAQEPRRVLDTRGVSGAPVGAPIGVRGPDSLTTVSIGGDRGEYLVLNLAIVNATGPGYLQVFPTGWGAPGAASNRIVSAAGQTRANIAIVPMGESGSLTFYLSGGGHIIADVVGSFGNYYAHQKLRTVDPYRAYDSDSCDTCTGDRIAGGTTARVQLGGTTAPPDPANGLPLTYGGNTVDVAVVAVTVTDPVAKGYLSLVTPGAALPPTTSTLNFGAGESLTTTAFVNIGGSSAGATDIFVSQSARVFVDVIGYFVWAPGSDGLFTGLSPTRVIDTRTGGGPKPTPGTTVNADISATLGVEPWEAGAVFVNSTSAQPSSAGVITTGETAAEEAYRTTTVPNTQGAVAAGTIAALAPNAQLTMHTTATTHLVADVAGWFSFGVEPLAPGAMTPIASVGPSIEQVALSDNGTVAMFRSRDSATSYLNSTVTVWRDDIGLQVVVDDIEVQVTLSGDGTELLLITPQSLHSDDTDAATDLYAYDIGAGTFTLIPVHPTLTQAWKPTVSDNGDYVSFTSQNQLAAADTDSASDQYLFHRPTSTLTLVSLPSVIQGGWLDGGIVNGPGTHVVINATPRSGSSHQLFLYSIATGTLTPQVGSFNTPIAPDDISDTASQVMATNHNGVMLVVLPDFVTQLPGYPPIYPASNPSSGSMTGDGNVVAFVNSSSHYRRFIGASDPTGPLLFDRTTGTLQFAHRTWDGQSPDGGVALAAISDDGEWLLFISWATNLLEEPATGPTAYLLHVSSL